MYFKKRQTGLSLSSFLKCPSHLTINKILPLNQHRYKRRRRLDFFPQAEHFLVHEDRETEVERSGDTGDEIEGCEFWGRGGITLERRVRRKHAEEEW